MTTASPVPSAGAAGASTGAHAAAEAGWRAHLRIHYRHDGQRTTALDRHEGPLRVLQRLYPEGPGICHHVIVHPPGGIVGGDTLRVDVQADPGTHAVLTTPGATRFYRSEGPRALQQVNLQVHDHARVEWLPLETIAHRRCVAENRVTLNLAPQAQCMGWEVLALGLPAAGEAFDDGRFQQHLEWPGRWLERGLIRGDDTLLLDSPLGLAGQRVLGSLWLASGSPWPREQQESLAEAARALLGTAQAGVTAVNEHVLVLRVLAARVEPAMQLLQAVRACWRQAAWGLDGVAPRVWRT